MRKRAKRLDREALFDVDVAACLFSVMTITQIRSCRVIGLQRVVRSTAACRTWRERVHQARQAHKAQGHCTSASLGVAVVEHSPSSHVVDISEPVRLVSTESPVFLIDSLTACH